VTQVKHFDGVFVFLNSIVNDNRDMLQVSDAGPPSDRAFHAGESAKQIDVVEPCAAKTAGGLAIFLGNVTDDFSEVP
jgi:hypothetical protein